MEGQMSGGSAVRQGSDERLRAPPGRHCDQAHAVCAARTRARTHGHVLSLKAAPRAVRAYKRA